MNDPDKKPRGDPYAEELMDNAAKSVERSERGILGLEPTLPDEDKTNEETPPASDEE